MYYYVGLNELFLWNNKSGCDEGKGAFFTDQYNSGVVIKPLSDRNIEF